MKQRRNEDAIKAFQQAIEIDPKNVHVWSELGNLYFKKGKYAEAIPLYQKSIELLKSNRDKALSWNRLGDAYRRLHDYNHAVAAYQQADKLDAHPASFGSDLDENPHGLGQLEEGIAAGQEVMEDEAMAASEEVGEPEAAPALLGNDGMAPRPAAAQPSAEVKPAAEAAPAGQESYSVDWLEDLEVSEAIEAPSATPQAAVPSGELVNWLRELEETPSFSPGVVNRDLLSEAMQEDAHYGLGQLEESVTAGQEVMENEAIAASEEAGEPGAHPASLGSGLGEIHIEKDSKNAYKWNEQGNTYLKTGSYDEAIAAYIKAIGLAPKLGWPYSNLALAYFHKGKYAEAIPLYRKSIELLKSNRDKALSWNRLGDAYRRLHDYNHAVAAYQRAVELDSDTNSLLTRARFSLLSNTRG